MRVLVCGSRTWDDYEIIHKELLLLDIEHKLEVVIEGEARGADRMAGKAAAELSIPVLKYPAQWNKYGKAAGLIRNKQMLVEAKPDFVLAFANPTLAASRGTYHMVSLAREAGLQVKVIEKCPTSS